MESSLVSWQVENFSSAELVSPPISPAPPSPSFYNNNGVPSVTPTPSGKVGVSNNVLTNRAQIASNILHDLEEQGSLIMDMNDFGMNWNEESVNLNLFEELEEIEYTPPASPNKQRALSLSFAEPSSSSQHQQDVYYEHNLNTQASESSTDISVLTAEFQAILDSLPKESLYNTEVISQVLKNAGIPTTIVDGEALVPVELDLSNITAVQDLDAIMEVDDLNPDIIDESELYDLSDVSNYGSPASSVHSSYELIEDHHSEAAEKILDALLQGDVATAEAILPEIDDDSSMSSFSSQDSSSDDSSYHLPSTSKQALVAAAAPEPKKQERRGRKPGKKLAKNSTAYVKDKTLRKKEQNKTAATRYRQKKKMEFALILESEAQLQDEHDSLEKQKNDLHREILMIRQLLRDVIKARKPSSSSTASNNIAGKSIVASGRLTASSLVGRNRRK